MKIPTVLSRFMLTSIILGLLGIIIGIVLVMVGANISSASPYWSNVLTSLGTAILTASVIGIVYESLQKEVLAGDIKKIFGISQSMQSSGWQSSTEADDRDKIVEFFKASEIAVAPLDPEEWYRNHSYSLLNAVAKRKTKLTLWIPEFDEESLAEVLIIQSDITLNELSDRVSRFVNRIENDWNKATIYPGSELHIKTYYDIPQFGVYSGISTSFLEFRQVLPTAPTVMTRRWIEVGSVGVLKDWIDGEIIRLENSGNSKLRLIKVSQVAVTAPTALSSGE
ncbi:UNVERIFIED_CONTAM: hypothetical protein ABIE34_001699 [Jeotgalibacillus campisalis]